MGLVFVTTGWGKLQNLDRVIEFFRSLGIPAPEYQAPFVAATELACGLLLVLGLGTRFAAVPIQQVEELAAAGLDKPAATVLLQTQDGQGNKKDFRLTFAEEPGQEDRFARAVYLRLAEQDGKEFRDLPEAERSRADAVCAKTYELTDFLVNVARLETVPGSYAGTITYHDSCSGLRELGIKAQPRTLLAKVPGLTLTEMNEAEQCCGFGGSFAVRYPEISASLVNDKVNCALSTKADVLVSTDAGCLMNIGGRLHRRGEQLEVLHIAELLDQR